MSCLFSPCLMFHKNSSVWHGYRHPTRIKLPTELAKTKQDTKLQYGLLLASSKKSKGKDSNLYLIINSNSSNISNSSDHWRSTH